jgi:hypothetical protein
MIKSNILHVKGMFYELSVLTIDVLENEDLFEYVKTNHKILSRYSEIEERLRNQTEWAGYLRFNSADLFSCEYNDSALHVPRIKIEPSATVSESTKNQIFFHKVSVNSVHELVVSADFDESTFELVGDDLTELSKDEVTVFTTYYAEQYLEFISSETQLEYFSVFEVEDEVQFKPSH